MGYSTMEGYAQGAAEGLWSREQALRGHIVGNFYPPHPAYVQSSMMEGFKKYWEGKINLDQLQKACYLRNKEGLYKYFGSFLNEEDQ